jgi:hypothetical protein
MPTTAAGLWAYGALTPDGRSTIVRCRCAPMQLALAGGLGFAMCTALDLAIVADLLPDRASVAKDLGMMNIAGALPFSLGSARIAPALAARQVR